VREFEEAGISVHSALFKLNVSDLRSLVTLAGLQPSEPSRRISEETLIEMVRDFYTRNRRLPTSSDFRRGLLPHRNAMFRRFGGMVGLLSAAGFNPVAEVQ